MTTTLTRSAVRPRGTTPSSYECVNPEHCRLAACQDAIRLRDRRFVFALGQIPQHDYCTGDLARTELRYRGRPATCPGGADFGHIWVEAD